MMNSTPYYLVGSIAVCALVTFAEDAGRVSVPDDPMSRPTEYGIRFTPKMARGMSDIFARHVCVHHYKLDESRVDEASEAIARRLMELAHANDRDQRGQELAEFAIGEVFNELAKSRNGRGLDGLPRNLGMGIGKRILPMMPDLRECVRNVGQDLRPMLAMKEQLKLGRDLILIKTGLDAFEANMKLWAAGDVDPHANPFEPRDKEIETDENGESQALKMARSRAQDDLEKQWSEWEKYVEQAKAFYEFDESQSATAGSVLRELTERARSVVQDETWHKQAYRNRVWASMFWALRLGRNNPLRECIEEHYREMAQPIKDLEEELKHRIDQIPTQAQRGAAQQRIMAALIEQGFEPDQGASGE